MARRSKTVASALVREIMASAQAAGMGPAEFTKRTGVTAAEASDPGGRIGRVKYERVLPVLLATARWILEEVPKGELGWLEAAFPLLAGALLNARSAREALGAYLRYRPLVGESDAVELRETDAAAQLEYVAEGPRAFAAVQAAGNFALVIHLLRAYDQGPPTRFTAEFTSAPPGARGWLEGLLDRPPPCGSARNLLRFPRGRLDAPSPRHNPPLARILARQLDAQLAELQRDDALSLKVERSLRRLMSGPGAGRALGPERPLERICDDLGMTRWTLRRHLAEEGVTFDQLHLGLKRGEARRLLEETSLSLGEVSDRLGFSTHGAFTRFFRHEHGVTPLWYRRHAAGRWPPLAVARGVSGMADAAGSSPAVVQG